MRAFSITQTLVAAALCCTILAACGSQGGATRSGATRGSSGGTIDIAVFGDMPYINGMKEPKPVLDAYRYLLDDIDASDHDFIVHLGDYTNGPFCGDSIVNVRYNEFESMRSPFIFLPGDNDWTDCARGGFDPLERLQKLRDVFAAGDQSLGQRKLRLERQSSNPRYAKFRENVRWSIGDALFIGLNVPGSNNNWGPDSARPSAEYVERNGACLAWLRESFALAASQNRKGIAIFLQADPGFDRSQIPPEYRPYFKGFDEMLGTLRELTMQFGKPVLYVHGDSHYYIIDKPLNDTTGHVLANFTRAEGFGAQNMHWIRITADPADPNYFSITPMLVQKNTRW